MTQEPITNSGWLSIDSAPHDGTTIIIKTHRAAVFEAYYDALGSLDENQDVCGQWVAAKDGVAPPCWTDGACWAENEDEKMSDQPEFWRAPQ